MKTFFLAFGILAALTTSSKYELGYNIAAAIIAASCFVCAVIAHFIESRDETSIKIAELNLKLEKEKNKSLKLDAPKNTPNNDQESTTLSINKD